MVVFNLSTILWINVCATNNTRLTAKRPAFQTQLEIAGTRTAPRRCKKQKLATGTSLAACEAFLLLKMTGKPTICPYQFSCIKLE